MEKHFAALKLFDSDSDKILKEALNYSETSSSHRICLNQIYRSKSQSNLVRQYSYEQIFNENITSKQIKLPEFTQTGNKAINYQTTEFYYSPNKSLNRQFSKSSNILQAPKFVLNKTSNEISSSANNINESNSLLYCPIKNTTTNVTDTKKEVEELSSVKLNNCEEVHTISEVKDVTKIIDEKTYQNIKKKFRPLVMKNKIAQKKKTNMCYYSCLTLGILPVIAIIFALLLDLNVPTFCDRAMIFSNASQELQKKIHGQENAISQIIKHLNQDFFYLKVLCLIGGTGVGKSYTVDTIAKHFPFRKAIHTYDALLDYSMDINILNSLPSYQLFIMENLKIKDLDVFSNILDALSQKRDKCITIIAIFNVEEVNDNLERKIDLIQSRNKIQEILIRKKIDSLIVPYQPLSEETLQTCIIEAATASDLTLTLDQINEIKKSLLQFGSGCKGAYAKVQIIDKH